jgi:hypothetical protein
MHQEYSGAVQVLYPPRSLYKVGQSVQYTTPPPLSNEPT